MQFDDDKIPALVATAQFSHRSQRKVRWEIAEE